MKQDSTVAIDASPVESRGVLEPGQYVGHYVVSERLGRGGFGEVWRARHDAIARDVAIKVLHEKYSRDATAVARFVAEAKAANTIDHPNIVQVFDFGALPDGRNYFVMELLRGSSLKQILVERGALPLVEALPIFRAIAEAVDAAHAVGLAHRDLKPDNVFVLTDGRVKVIDFGLVKLVGDDTEALTETGVIAGTPLYMSPEQFRGKNIGLATDSYSFGALAYHVLVGEPPFVAKDPIVVGLMHIQDAPVAPSVKRPTLGADVDRWVMALLAKEPEQRPQSLVAALGAATVESIGTSSTIMIGQLAVPAPPSHKWAWIVGAGVVVAIAAGAAVFLRGHATEASVQPTTPRVAIRAVPAIAAHGELAPAQLIALQAASARMLAAGLLDAPGRRFWIARDQTHDLALDVAARVDGEEVRVEVRRDDRVIAAATGGSVREAITRLVPVVATELSIGRPPAGPDGDEVQAVQDVHAPSVEAYRAYRAIVDEYERSYWASGDVAAVKTDQLSASYPHWIRPYMLLCIIHGRVAAACTRELAAERANTDPASDPVGHALLEQVRAGTPTPSPSAVENLPGIRGDLETAVWLFGGYVAAQRLDDAIALLSTYYKLRPELECGQGLMSFLRLAGRAADADAVAREWATLRPEADQSLVAFATVAANEGDTAAGIVALRLRHVLLGEDHDAWLPLADAYLALGDFATARHFVDRALASDPLMRAHGRYRGGRIAILEGRFTVAYDTLLRAATENLPFGTQSEYTQVVSELRALADLVGAPGDDRRHVKGLRDIHFLGAGVEAALDYELSLLDRRPGAACPGSDPAIAAVPEGIERTTARRRILRLAASRRCAPCRAAVDAGLSESEWSSRSLYLFGLCAEHEHQPELARIVYARAAAIDQDSNEASLFDSMRATAHLGAVLAELGDRDGARRYLRPIVTRWGSSDHAIPELDLARKVLATLDAK